MRPVFIDRCGCRLQSIRPGEAETGQDGAVGVKSLNAKTHRRDSAAVLSSDDGQESGRLFSGDLRYRLGRTPVDYSGDAGRRCVIGDSEIKIAALLPNPARFRSVFRTSACEVWICVIRSFQELPLLKREKPVGWLSSRWAFCTSGNPESLCFPNPVYVGQSCWLQR